MTRRGHSARDTRERVERLVHGVNFAGKKWVRFQCPFCFEVHGKRDRKTSLGVNAHSRAFHCFRCGTSGKLDDLEGYEAPPQVEGEPEEVEVKTMDPPDDYVALASELAQRSLSLEPAHAYIASRRVPPAVVERAQIGACVVGRWANRIILPVLTADRRAWFGWVGRVWQKDGGDIPYLYPKGMARGRFLYNHSALFERTDEPLLVVEGVFDALALGDAGVAVLGKPSAEQLEALLLTDRPVVWVLDGDAWEEAWALTARLRFEGRRSGFVRLPPKLDPDEVPLDALLLDAARSVDAPL